MSLPVFPRFVSLAIASFILYAGTALATGEGQDDLDKAMEAKLNATTIHDLGEVVDLADSALKKGLDDENADFAKKLLASTLLQRAREVGKQLLAGGNTQEEFLQKRNFTLADLERAVSLDPKQPETYLLIAQLNLTSGGDQKKARDAIDQALTLGLEDPSAHAKALLLHATLAEDDEKKLADLDKAVELDPNNGSLHEARGNVLAQMDRYDESLAEFEKMRQLMPDSLVPMLQKARIHSVQEKYDSALEDINQALAKSPDNVVVLLMRANLFETKGDLEKALADVDRAIKLKPDASIVIRTRAVLLAESKRYAEAEAELQKLLNADPKDLETLMQLGALYNMQMKMNEAVEIYTKLLTFNPEVWQALRGRGDAYLNLGRQADAIADYELALKREPDDHGILNNYAWVLATSPDPKIRDGKRAVELATRACEVTEYKLAHILSTLAAAYAETGDFDAAVKWSTKAVETGDAEHADSLKKELESYKAKKPWREQLLDGQPVESTEKPDAK